MQTYAEAEVTVAAHQGEYLLGLLDLNLPDASTGKSVSLAIANQIPAIVFTAVLDEAVRDKISSEKIIDYVLKQGIQDIEYLISLIERIDRNRSTTILVVEDSAVARRYICNLLKVHQYNLLEAENGAAAIKQVAAHPEIQMVITDYEMPVMDGFELTKELRTRFKKDELSIIGVSAQDNNLLAAKFIKNGANDFIGKPFFVEEFHCRVTQNIEIINHIARRKQVEQELRIAMAAAEEAARAKSQFLANMSHEIRTPLHGIIGMAELARDTDLDVQQRQILSTIDTEAGSLLNIINDILDFSKIEAKKFDLEHNPFDLREVFESVARSLAFNAHQRGVVLNAYLPPALPTLLLGDMARLRQILVNLVGNAVKFTFKGEIDIRGELLADLGDRVQLRFSVRDTGIGISEAHQAVVFDSFTQADGSTSRKYGGTGLGTTISKQLAEMMGGQIGVDSELEKGSTFWFTAVFEKQSSVMAVPGTADIHLENKPVLMVTADDTHASVLSEYITWLGGWPVMEWFGETALSRVMNSRDDAAPYACILLDTSLPDMSGFDLMDTLLKTGVRTPPPIIPMVRAGAIEHGEECRRRGVTHWITRPLVLSELVAAFGHVMERPESDETDVRIAPAIPPLPGGRDRGEIRVLLVEDYPTNQQVALRHLERAGFQTVLAENGKQAVLAFQNSRIDLILMDIQMPEMDGYEATRAIRQLEDRGEAGPNAGKSGGIPIIAMTAHAIKSHRDQAMSVGMNDFVTKPLQPKNMVAIIDKWLRTAPSAAPDSTGENPAAADDPGSSPMDLARAVQEFEGDRDFLIEITAGFMENVRGQLQALRRAVADGDASVIRKEAHSIKGGAGNIAAFELMQAAEALETAGASEGLENSAGTLEILENAFTRLETYTQTHLTGETG